MRLYFTLLISVFCGTLSYGSEGKLLRLVCHRTAELKRPDLKIESVVILEQLNTEKYDGTDLMVDKMWDIMETDYIPFSMKVFRTEMLPDNVDETNVTEYSNALMTDDSKQALEIDVVGSRSADEFAFHLKSTDPAKYRTTWNVFMSQGSDYSISHYIYDGDSGTFNCIPPVLVPE